VILLVLACGATIWSNRHAGILLLLYVGTPENNMDFPHNSEMQGVCENIMQKKISLSYNVVKYFKNRSRN
jgi:hypothetical protein